MLLFAQKQAKIIMEVVPILDNMTIIRLYCNSIQIRIIAKLNSSWLV